MKKFLIIIFLVCVSCSKTTYPKFGYNVSESPYKDAFKDQVFFACLRESYNNPELFKLIEQKDMYNPYDGLSLESRELAKRLAKELVQNIPKPVMCEDCREGRNYYMAVSLHYYANRELDSIADMEYKKFVKQLDY